MAGSAPNDSRGTGEGRARAFFEPSGFKVKLVVLALEAGVLWAYNTSGTMLIVILLLSAGLLSLIHPWKMGNRSLQPEVVACMIGVASALTFVLSFALMIGVPKLGTWVDENGRQLVDLPTPDRELPQPWNNGPPAAAPPAVP